MLLVHVKCSKLAQGAGKHLAINNSGYNNISDSYYPKKKRTRKYSAYIYDHFCHYFPPSSISRKMYRQSLIVYIMFVIKLVFQHTFAPSY